MAQSSVLVNQDFMDLCVKIKLNIAHQTSVRMEDHALKRLPQHAYALKDILDPFANLRDVTSARMEEFAKIMEVPNLVPVQLDILEQLARKDSLSLSATNSPVDLRTSI